MGGKVSVEEVELSGRVAIVTGGNGGIGYETAKALALMGAHVIIAARSEQKAREAVERMKQEALDKELNVEYMILDLASLQSTKDFIENFKQKNLPLHLLLCNAGVAFLEQGKTGDGYETHFQVNHLGHFLICLELLPCIMATEGDKRIVLVSSSAHSSGVWDPSNLHGDVSYERFKFYGNSKLYNIMTMYALQRRAKDCGVTVSSLHPGMVKTDLIRDYNTAFSAVMKSLIVAPFGKTPVRGSMATLNCAVNPQLNTQQAFYYKSDCTATRPTAVAMNERFQEELWSISCDLLKDWMSPDIKVKYCEQDKPGEVEVTGSHDDKEQKVTGSHDDKEQEVTGSHDDSEQEVTGSHDDKEQENTGSHDNKEEEPMNATND